MYGQPTDGRRWSCSRTRKLAKIQSRGRSLVADRSRSCRPEISTGREPFTATGSASGESTQLGFEVDDIDAVVADLRARGVVFEEIDAPGFEVVDGIANVEGNYPSKGTGERGVWFRDSEGNLLALGQPIDRRRRTDGTQRTWR